MIRLIILITLVCILFFVEIKTKMLDIDFEHFYYKKNSFNNNFTLPF